MSSCHKVARLLVFISSTLCLHVQDEQLLRRRVTLTELDRGHFVQSLHNVERRDTTNSTNPSTPPVLGHFAHLRNDRHRLAIVHWSGENSSAIFILTTNRYRNGTSRESNLWRSIDYGYTFNNDNTKVNTAVLDYYYINPHDKMKLIFVGKIAHVLYITENEGQSYLPVKVPFVADDIDYNPSENRDTYLTAYDKTQKSLYVSTDYGKTWISLGRNITRYYWEVLTGEDDTKLYFEKLHMSGSKVYVVSYPYTSSSIMEFQPDTARPEFDQNVMVLSNEYILSQITDSTGSARLYVSYKRGRFVVARFPLQQQLIEKDYLLVDASEHQVFVAVNHRSNLTSLYMSETKGISYTLTLGDVVTTSDSSWNSNTARVQLYRVAGDEEKRPVFPQPRKVLDVSSATVKAANDGGALLLKDCTQGLYAIRTREGIEMTIIYHLQKQELVK
ncbi:VPS10 domain-containing receptor SorCS3-like [Corticium candelabrum]|uniref:VPS10 domain-containing receptor SorCS3-like n=1 Tax=Corticium candelabrum TaxID=121492 RepID=UPI002E26B449|nr:VPS10 domain-containing receptor SorCS3-like [Corticium candelabrum]